jgi:AAA family ATP:ADP antiporter
MMQIAAGILLLHLALYRVVNRRVSATGARPVQAPIKAGNGFALVMKSRYLGLLALLLVLLNIVNTVGEYILGRAVVMAADAQVAVQAGFDKEAYIGTFYGSYFFWTNVATIVIQAFLVSRIVKRFGMRGVLLALPLVALGAYGLAAAGAGLMALRSLKIAENSTDYSVNNTAKQMLWLPTSREEKYKAKQAIDTFFVRSGDMLAAGVVFLGTHGLALGVAGFARANIAVVLIAIFVAVLLLREYRRLTEQPSAGGAS